MLRRTSVVAAALVLPALLAGCGGEPEPLEALPPPAPADLCALLPAEAVEGLTGAASSSDDGNPTAACALRAGTTDAVLVTWLQLQAADEARTAYESQCAAIDRTILPEQPAAVEGADETCAGAAPADADPRASLVVLAGREVVTVRATIADPLARSTALATGLLPNLPRPQ